MGSAVIERLPAHWAIKRLRFVTTGIEQGWSPQCDNAMADEDAWGVMKVGCVNGHRFDPSENKALPAGLEPMPEYELQAGDILVSRANTKELVGSAAVVPKGVRAKLMLCDKLFRIKPGPDVHEDFLTYFLRTPAARFHYERDATGASGSMQNIGQDTLKDLHVPVPSRDEQAHIATFLDWKTAQIDVLIAKKQTLIEKLKEKRLAVITNAVTRGLAPAAFMRDSGIPWLGAVPAHWILNYKLGFLSASEKNSFVNGPFGSDLLTTELVDEGVPVLYSGDVKATRFLRKSGKYVTAEKALSLDFCRVDEGDVLLAKVGDPPGDACVYPLGSPPAVVTQDVVRIKVDRRTVHPEFLSYLLVSEMGRYLVKLVSVEATRGRFSLADLQSIRFPIPPLHDQEEIATHIAAELGEVDKMDELNETAIARLAEYRTALITAAVTGQIDVRHFVIPDPA